MANVELRVDHPSESAPFATLTAVVEASFDRVRDALLFADVGPARFDRGALLLLHREARGVSGSTVTGGPEVFTIGVGSPPGSKISLHIDYAAAAITFQGEWWFRGVYTLAPEGGATQIHYAAYNVAPARSRWLTRLMAWSYRKQMRATVDDAVERIRRVLGG